MSVRYDDRDVAMLLVQRGIATTTAIEQAARAASDPSPGRLVTTLLQHRVVEKAVLEQVLAELFRNQFRCRACHARFVSLPLDHERKVACPECQKWNLIPPRPAPAAPNPDAVPTQRVRTDAFVNVPGLGAMRRPTSKDEAGPASPASNDEPPKAPPRRRSTGPFPAPPAPSPTPSGRLAATRPLPQDATEPMGRAEAGAPGADPVAAAVPASRAARLAEATINAPLAAGDRFGKYEILGELARGAMGVLYRARHENVPDRTVALKVLQGDLAKDKEQVARFRREAEALARVEHPAVVRVHDAGQVEGAPFFTMELVEGANLEDRVREGVLDATDAARLMAQVAHGCAHLHAKGVIHRDLKLSNVLVGPDGRPRIADFGLARLLDRKTRLTLEGDMLGTPLYMAPEQIRGELDVDARTDVYALGVMLFRLVTREYPFQATAPTTLYAKVLTEPPTWPKAPEVPEALRLVVERCLEKEKPARYPGATALARDLEAFVAGAEVSVKPATLVERARRGLARRFMRVLAGVGVLAVAAVLVAGAVRVAQVLASRAHAKRLQEACARVRAAADALSDETNKGFKRGGLAGVKEIDAALERAQTVPLEGVQGPAELGHESDLNARALVRELAALDLEKLRAELRKARVLAALAVDAPQSPERLALARRALARTVVPPEGALAAAGVDPKTWAPERVAFEEAREQVLVLAGSVGEAREAAANAFGADPAAPEGLRDVRALACARLSLLDDATAAVASWLAAASHAAAPDPAHVLPFGEDARTREELAAFAELAAAAERGDVDALDRLGTAPHDAGESAWRQVFLATVARERVRPRIRAGDPGVVARLDAPRAELRALAKKLEGTEDGALSRVALGELELACGRPLSAAETFVMAEGSNRAHKVTAVEALAVARNPAVVELVPGVLGTASLRAAAALGLARARGRLLDETLALHAAEDAVAATSSSGAPACAADLALAAAHRTRGELDLASEADARAERGLAALGGLESERAAKLREAVAASRARTKLAAAWSDSGLAPGEVEAAAKLLPKATEALTRETALLARALERLSETASVGAESDQELADLVGRARAELAAGAGLHDSVELARDFYEPRRQERFARALRAAVLACERDPSSPAALAVLARAWLANERPPARALAFAAKAVELAQPPSPEPLLARALARLRCERGDAALAAATRDFEAAEDLIAHAPARELERDADLVATCRLAARALREAGAAKRALAQRLVAADLADAHKLATEVRMKLHAEAESAAQAAGDAAAAQREQERGAAAKRDHDVIAGYELTYMNALKDLRQRMLTTADTTLPPSIEEMLWKGFEITRAEPLGYGYAGLFLARNSWGPNFPAFSAYVVQEELGPDLGMFGLEEERDKNWRDIAKREKFIGWAYPERPELTDLDGSPLAENPRLPHKPDPDLRGASAFAFGLGSAADLAPREGLAFAERLLRRRPELRIAHVTASRLRTYAGDFEEAVDELELALELAKPFEESGPALLADGKPVNKRSQEGLTLYLLAEAQLARKDMPGAVAAATEALRRAIDHGFALPERVQKRFADVLAPRDLEDLMHRMQEKLTEANRKENQ